MDYAPSLPSPMPLALQWQRQSLPTLAWHTQPLPPQQAVQVLDFRRGETALLEVEHGRVWVTCDGRLEDYFLDAGQRLSFAGPARLRVSAESSQARLCWARLRGAQAEALIA